jgi:hypothetical protein
MKSPYPRRFPKRFRPGLERLETRDCPSCTVIQKGATLSILGDREANQIAIADTREGDIAVICDGGDPHRFEGVRLIDMQTRGGDDEVTVALANLASPTFMFRVDLGAGNDRLSISGFDKRPDPPIHALSFDIGAGAGDDEITANFSRDEGPEEFHLRADLGAGNDEFMMRFQPGAGVTRTVGDPHIQLDLLGCQGNDCIELAMDEGPEERSFAFNADMDATLDGGAGDDEFMMNLGNVSLNGQFMMHTDGGAGDDQFMMNLGDVALKGNFMMNTGGGAGDDQFMMNVGDLKIDGQFMMHTGGGAGDDRIAARVGNIDGQFMMSTDGGAGNDSIAARVGFDPQPDPPSFRGQMNLSATGGAGDDRIAFLIGNSADTRGPAILDGRLRLGLDGGAGNDRAMLDVANLDIHGAMLTEFQGSAGADQFLMNVAHDVDVFGTLDVRALGGAGNDVIGAVGGPCDLPSGRSMFVFDGEAGNDRISFQVEQDEDDTGVLGVILRGGTGNDDLTLEHRGSAPDSIFAGALDGGLGHDVAHLTRNVRVANCEDLVFLD